VDGQPGTELAYIVGGDESLSLDAEDLQRLEAVAIMTSKCRFVDSIRFRVQPTLIRSQVLELICWKSPRCGHSTL
jgi:hypothetical protein